MKINFFEEFPTRKNLKKAALIKFPSIIYLAAKSLDEFQKLKSQLKKINPRLEAGYWPILPSSYWVSPFSDTADLEELIRELSLNKNRLKVMVDLELPFHHLKLFFKNILSFPENKRLIESIFSRAKQNHLEILTAEYPVLNCWVQKKLEGLGISYPVKKYPHKKIVMFYTSMIRLNLVKTKIKSYIKKNRYLQVGLGTIAFGILGNEPILSLSQLEQDLVFLRNNNIDTAVIFRLGGLNQKYLQIIKKYL